MKCANRNATKAFTLIELLVVIVIIALLIAILVPTVQSTLATARSNKSLGNLRQLAMGISLYTLDQKGYLPAGGYPAPPTPRIRWADSIWPYMTTREMYLSPQLDSSDLARMVTPFAHDTTMTFGGYGYNYQYLGNGRHVATWSAPYNVPFLARISSIQSPSNTITLCDAEGTKAE